MVPIGRALSRVVVTHRIVLMGKALSWVVVAHRIAVLMGRVLSWVMVTQRVVVLMRRILSWVGVAHRAMMAGMADYLEETRALEAEGVRPQEFAPVSVLRLR